mmetsp:Transcript_10265/g.25796  ORF Transcript_10265/g.25796 Transcript_10265/m.25796 type:complete len:422 (+) Transcript_10265:393-1658(+)
MLLSIWLVSESPEQLFCTSRILMAATTCARSARIWSTAVDPRSACRRATRISRSIDDRKSSRSLSWCLISGEGPPVEDGDGWKNRPVSSAPVCVRRRAPTHCWHMGRMAGRQWRETCTAGLSSPRASPPCAHTLRSSAISSASAEEGALPAGTADAPAGGGSTQSMPCVDSTSSTSGWLARPSTDASRARLALRLGLASSNTCAWWQHAAAATPPASATNTVHSWGVCVGRQAAGRSRDHKLWGVRSEMGVNGGSGSCRRKHTTPLSVCALAERNSDSLVAAAARMRRECGLEPGSRARRWASASAGRSTSPTCVSPPLPTDSTRMPLDMMCRRWGVVKGGAGGMTSSCTGAPADALQRLHSSWVIPDSRLLRPTGRNDSAFDGARNTRYSSPLSVLTKNVLSTSPKTACTTGLLTFRSSS